MSTKISAINTKTPSPVAELSDKIEQDGHDAEVKLKLPLYACLIQIFKELESLSPGKNLSPELLKHFFVSSVDISLNERLVSDELFSSKASGEDENRLLDVFYMLDIMPWTRERLWRSWKLLIFEMEKSLMDWEHREIGNYAIPLSHLDAALMCLTRVSESVDILDIQIIAYCHLNQEDQQNQVTCLSVEKFQSTNPLTRQNEEEEFVIRQQQPTNHNPKSPYSRTSGSFVL
ncbi:hypothetical protein B0J11DRAFT_599755 [Dendryphion nanum]|uniref:Uncharacterized protein n=1 Tax=Dendryphion nanum TaxID=256645 RepID=A0A9P9ISL8_9PLEO|nr:hypothetical protein B0J11DRAFT_599755 [Dendryphion nanum]